MKLGAKITLGFAGLIVVTLLLGGLAIWKMTSVKTTATRLEKETVPEVAMANNVERWSLNTVFEMRGYAYTEETNFLEKARKNLKDVKQYLADAKKHGDSSVRLAKLKSAAEKAESAALEYERQAEETVALTEALEKERKDAEGAAGKYMKACSDWLTLQNKRLDEAIGSGAKAEVAKAIIKKQALANDIIDLGNWIITGTWKAQFRRDPKLFTDTKNLFVQVNQKLEELKKLQPDAEESKLIEACGAAGAAYQGNMERFLEKWFKREEVGRKRLAAAELVLAEAKTTAEMGMADTADATGKAASALAGASVTLIVGLCAAALVGGLMAVFITRSVTKPIRQVANQLSAGAEQTLSASDQVSASSQSLAEGASEQAASLEETSSSLEEMASMTQRNADSSQKANELAKEARAAADRGSRDMQAMSSAMEAIKASSDDIAKIIKTIDEIAFQTNILALNAAVEAARAGEAGMGFAVVADEVRSLAQRCAQAAKETSGKIEGAIGKTTQGVEICAKVATALDDIVTKARSVDELAAEVASASREQTQGIGQINTAVTQMDKVTQSNAANAEESAAASEELNAQALSMNEAVTELLRLVDGQARTVATPANRVIQRKDRPHPAPATQAPSSNGDSRPPHQNIPSRKEPRQPETALAASRQHSEIPMPDQFKDF